MSYPSIVKYVEYMIRNLMYFIVLELEAIENLLIYTT